VKVQLDSQFSQVSCPVRPAGCLGLEAYCVLRRVHVGPAGTFSQALKVSREKPPIPSYLTGQWNPRRSSVQSRLRLLLQKHRAPRPKGGCLVDSSRLGWREKS